jgi:hypothetical protein
MPLERGSSRAVVSRNIKTEMGAGKPQRQAVAIAMRLAGKSRGAKDAGYVRSAHMAQLSEQARVEGNHEQADHLMKMSKEARAEERRGVVKKATPKKEVAHPLGGFKTQSNKSYFASYQRAKDDAAGMVTQPSAAPATAMSGTDRKKGAWDALRGLCAGARDARREQPYFYEDRSSQGSSPRVSATGDKEPDEVVTHRQWARGYGDRTHGWSGLSSAAAHRSDMLQHHPLVKKAAEHLSGLQRHAASYQTHPSIGVKPEDQAAIEGAKKHLEGLVRGARSVLNPRKTAKDAGPTEEERVANQRGSFGFVTGGKKNYRPSPRPKTPPKRISDVTASLLAGRHENLSPEYTSSRNEGSIRRATHQSTVATSDGAGTSSDCWNRFAKLASARHGAKDAIGPVKSIKRGNTTVTYHQPVGHAVRMAAAKRPLVQSSRPLH